MVRSFQGVCLICFCILGLALVVAILEVAALPVMLNATGCQSNFEILPNFTCGRGLIRRSIEVILNLPLCSSTLRHLRFSWPDRQLGISNFCSGFST
jgi:hypothetical protein